MDQKILNKILEKHKKWLDGKPDGERAVLSYRYMSYSDLSYSNLRDCEMTGCDMTGCDMTSCNMIGCDMTGCDMRGCDMRGCDMRYSNMIGCDMRGCDMTGCDMRGSNLRDSDLSGCTGLVSPIQYMKENFERSADGYIAYKVFNAQHIAPGKWILQPGAVIEEIVNANRTDNYGCGINVATLDWVEDNCRGEVWKVLIRWEWLPGVCVPYNTDGQIRCERVELIEIVQ